jgi:ribosome-associated translation inhibitor RaiA
MAPTARINFQHADRSPALEARARELVERLYRFNERISACAVTVQGRPGSQLRGAPFVVKIELAVPGAQIHADSHHGPEIAHDDVYVALREAFENAKRQLQDLHRERIDTRVMR